MSETSVQTRVGEVRWHDLMTNDVEAAKTFYGELLGWEFNVWKPGELDYPMIHVRESDHGGIVKADPDRGTPSHWIAYIHVDDVDSTILRAEQEGATIAVQPTDIPEVGRFAIIVDPQGAAISPFTSAYDSPAPQGTFMWEELYSADADGAKRFYGAVFGWTSREMDMGGGQSYTILSRADGEDVAGIWPKSDGASGPAAWHTYLATPDVDAATAKAAKLGATTYMEPMTVEGVGKFSILGDPTGAMFGLFEVAAD
jgi:uncharacterized protein